MNASAWRLSILSVESHEVWPLPGSLDESKWDFQPGFGLRLNIRISGRAGIEGEARRAHKAPVRAATSGMTREPSMSETASLKERPAERALAHRAATDSALHRSVYAVA